MDNLKDIVGVLPDKAVKEFRLFLKRQKNADKRKDLQLFELLLEENFDAPEQYIRKLYHEPNSNAYHALRKRLFRQLTSFLVLKRTEEDSTSAARLMGMITLSRYLLDQNQDRLAWIYLLRAEGLALQNEQYELLNSIYQIQIENADSEHAPDIKALFRKRNKYRALADQQERTLMASSLIRQRLKEVRLQSKQLNFDRIIDKTLAELELEDVALTDPKILYNILSMTRSGMLAKKDFYSFEPYILDKYQVMISQGAFSKASHIYLLNILYMLCHVLYRNRKFAQAYQYLKEMDIQMRAYDQTFYPKFVVRHGMLLAATLNYMGDNATAIQILRSLLSEKHYAGEPERLNILVNLGIYLFQSGNLKEAARLLYKMGHSDHWYEKNMGREWTMKKYLMESILQYELGNIDLFVQLIGNFEKRYADLFKKPLYKRVLMYKEILMKVIDQPGYLSPATFQQEIFPQLTIVPEEQEDLQAMAFYSWLKAKFLHRDFYEVLLETVE